MVLCLVTLTDLQMRRAGLSASAELLVISITITHQPLSRTKHGTNCLSTLGLQYVVSCKDVVTALEQIHMFVVILICSGVFHNAFDVHLKRVRKLIDKIYDFLAVRSLTTVC